MINVLEIISKIDTFDVYPVKQYGRKLKYYHNNMLDLNTRN